VPVDYYYDPDLNAVVTAATGRTLAKEARAQLERALEDDRIQPGCVYIVDLSGAEYFVLDRSDAEEIASTASQVHDHKAITDAMVLAPSAVSARIAWMFQDMLGQKGMRIEVHIDWTDLAPNVLRLLCKDRT